MIVTSPRRRWLLILFVVLIAAGSISRPLMCGGEPIHLGLDLHGGVELVYELPEAAGLPPAEAAEALDSTRRILRQRLDAHGVKEISVRTLGTDRIEIAIPGITPREAEAYKRTLGSMGRLEFLIEAGPIDGVDVEAERRALQEELARAERLGEPAAPGPITTDLLGSDEAISFRWFPLSAGLQRELHRVRDTAAATADQYVLLRVDDRAGHAFTGDDVEKAYPTIDQRTSAPVVAFEIERRSEHAFGAYTEHNRGRRMAIVLDGRVESVAKIESRIDRRGQITRGSAGFEAEELQRLVTVIRSGSLPLEPVLIAESAVGPHLGQAALSRGIAAGLVALTLVLFFLLLYYRRAGLVACLALLLNLMLLLGALAFLRATLTLPGIAGLVLTIGMAVDANILIFERIREQLDEGASLRPAVRNGFESALRTIVDANVTTFLTAVFLYHFGTGPIRGFAVTLMIGLVTSMFSSLFFARSLLDWLLQRDWLRIGGRRLFASSRLSFVRHGRRALAASALVIVPGLFVFSITGPEKYGMDFTGGHALQLAFDEPHEQFEVLTRVRSVDPGAQVVTIDSEGAMSKLFLVQTKRTGPAVESEAPATAGDAAPAFAGELLELFGDELVQPITITDYEVEAELDQAFVGLDLRYREEVRRSDLEARVSSLLRDASVQGPETDDRFHVEGRYRSPPDTAAEAGDRIAEVVRELPAASGHGSALLCDPLPSSSFVGPRVGAELLAAAASAAFFALASIVLYLRVRFHQYRFGLAACVALVHDLLFTVSAIALARWTGLLTVELDLAVVAALLTIMGYSLNDTIVTFDRVRHNLPRTNLALPKLLDLSVRQTLSRTLLTTVTTFAVVLVLMALNVGRHGALEGFAFALLVGIVAGTFSTIYVATPALLFFSRWSERREARATTGAAHLP